MDSIVTDIREYCFFCGGPAECDHHLIFGTSNRALADQDGITVPICNECHNMGKVTARIHDNPMAEKLSKMLGQLAWENKHIEAGIPMEMARESFRKRYGKSYI